MKLKVSKIAEFIAAPPTASEQVACGYSIDSRSIQAGELFFAVKGERLDGHDYVNSALEKGAVAAVVSKAEMHRYSSQARLLPVEDTLLALQNLAAAVRRGWGKTPVRSPRPPGKTATQRSKRARMG